MCWSMFQASMEVKVVMVSVSIPKGRRAYLAEPVVSILLTVMDLSLVLRVLERVLSAYNSHR